MKKLILLSALLALSVANAQTKTGAPATAPAATASSSKAAPLPFGLSAVGWDGYLQHITARLGLTANTGVDVGARVNINTATDVTEFEVSGLYLVKLQDWGIVDNYLVAGGLVGFGEEFSLAGFAGMQPEITFLDRFIVSVRFGFEVPIVPDFALTTVGAPISLVEGVSFKIVW